MHRMLNHIALGAATAALVVCSGCASQNAEQGSASTGGMGMGGGGEGMGPGSVVAEAGSAALDMQGGSTTTRGVNVSRVIAPVDGWLVARSTQPPGAVLGSVRVRKGENSSVVVPLTAANGAQARIALHVDRGQDGVLDFDPSRRAPGFDAPVFVDRKAVEQTVDLRAYGSTAVPNSVLLLVEDQKLVKGSLRVAYIIVPAQSWISVNRVENGLPGRRVGLIGRAPGEWHEIDVPLKGAGGATDLLVTVHADTGSAGEFEYWLQDPLGSFDQPWKDSGVIVSKQVAVTQP